MQNAAQESVMLRVANVHQCCFSEGGKVATALVIRQEGEEIVLRVDGERKIRRVSYDVFSLAIERVKRMRK